MSSIITINPTILGMDHSLVFHTYDIVKAASIDISLLLELTTKSIIRLREFEKEGIIIQNGIEKKIDLDILRIEINKLIKLLDK